MRKEIKTEFKQTPLVGLGGPNVVPGLKFKGVIVGECKPFLKGKYPKFIYTFTIKDGNAPLTIKDSDGKYVEAEVSEGDEVAYFAPEGVHNKLKNIPVGSTVELETALVKGRVLVQVFLAEEA